MTAEVRERYDQEVRQGPVTPDPRYRVEWDGPVYRLTGPGPEPHDNAVLFARFAPGEDPGAHVARQVAHFARLGHAFEWQLHDHDRPPGLAEHLRAAGLVPGEPETVAVASLTSFEPACEPDPELELVRLSPEDPLDPVGALNQAVYGDPDHAAYLVRSLTAERAADPRALSVYVARARGQVVAAGWSRFPAQGSFVSLWGGATLSAWRGKGIYRRLVAARAAEARARGHLHLVVHAGPQSWPILARLGFARASVLTPWTWQPASPA